MATAQELAAALAGLRQWPQDDPIAGHRPASVRIPQPPRRTAGERLGLYAQPQPDISPALANDPRALLAAAQRAPLARGEAARQNLGANIADMFLDPLVAAGEMATGKGSALEGLGGILQAAVPGGVAAKGAMKATERLAPQFYSGVERALQTASQNKASPKEWAGFLRNAPGVKAEELRQLGLEHLPDAPTTKADLLAHVQGKQVQLGEVQKGFQSSAAQHPALNEYVQQVMSDSPGMTHEQAVSEVMDSVNRGRVTIPGMEEQASRNIATKFSQYQLPGATNYGEKLLTLPTYHEDLKNFAQRRGIDNIREGEQAFQSATGYNPNTYPTYKSSHWDEPNVLVHIRHNDRTLPSAAEGGPERRALHLEEVQSDLHQQGRKYGYKNEENAQARQDAADKMKIEYRRLTAVHPGISGVEQERIFNADPGYRAAQQAFETADQRITNKAVPDFPFKTTWPDLALKRMVRQAAEGGYDALSWTPGKAQAERYPEALRQAVSNISWSAPGLRPGGDQMRYLHATPTGGGRDLVFTVDPNGMIVEASANQAKGKHIEELFGKDMAASVMAKPEGDIPAKDFVIGSKGMEGFYDKMLVDKANALGKKYGAKVEQNVPLSDRKIEQKPNGNWQVTDAAGNVSVSKSLPQDAGTAHVLPITPELRKAVLEQGFPLYSAAGAGAALGASMAASEQQAAPGVEDENARLMRALQGGAPISQTQGGL